MPLYGFTCDNCGEYFEKDLLISNRDMYSGYPCLCGHKFRRTVGCAGFVLKGSCWSRDNYATCLGDDPRGHFQQDRPEDNE